MACEAMMGGGAGKGLRTRGCLHYYHVCLTSLPLPLPLTVVTYPLAAHHGLTLACHEGGGCGGGQGRHGIEGKARHKDRGLYRRGRSP